MTLGYLPLFSSAQWIAPVSILSVALLVVFHSSIFILFILLTSNFVLKNH